MGLLISITNGVSLQFVCFSLLVVVFVVYFHFKTMYCNIGIVMYSNYSLYE